MARLHLVHWHEAEARERAARLRRAGHTVRPLWGQGGEAGRAIAAKPPDAVVIDLGRLPSHGRSIAFWLRERKATRALPLVFVGGDDEKVARLKRALPDAVYTTWPRVRSAVRRALAHPPAAPVVPDAPDYSGTPLVKKLGVKPGARLALLGAPRGFDRTLGALPDGVRTVTRAAGTNDVVLLFVKSRAELGRRFDAAVRALGDPGGLWIAWPKKAAAVATDLTQADVRRYGLDRGLVDNKICAVDATWSGLRFTRRRR